MKATKPVNLATLARWRARRVEHYTKRSAAELAELLVFAIERMSSDPDFDDLTFLDETARKPPAKAWSRMSLGARFAFWRACAVVGARARRAA